MKRKLLLSFLLFSGAAHASPSPLLPPTIYLALNTYNPAALCTNLCFIFYQFASAYLSAPTQLPTLAQPSNSPHETVFAFDLHDVLFTPDYIQRLTILLNSPHHLIALKYLANPLFLYEALRLTNQQIAAEQVLDKLLPSHPDLALLLPTIVAMINAQKPIQGTIDLMKRLKHQGFKIYLLSNIGDRVLKDMIKKFPDIFVLFDELFFCSAEYGYIRKPNPKFYEFFFEKFNLQPHNIIFVDDLVKNIKAADDLGMYGILFNCPEELEKQLKKLNITTN